MARQHRHDHHVRRAVLAFDHVGPIGADLFGCRNVVDVHRGRALIELGQDVRDLFGQRTMPVIGEDADPERATMACLVGMGLCQGDADDHRRFIARVVEHPEQPMIGVAFRRLGNRVLFDHGGIMEEAGRALETRHRHLGQARCGIVVQPVRLRGVAAGVADQRLDVLRADQTLGFGKRLCRVADRVAEGDLEPKRTAGAGQCLVHLLGGQFDRAAEVRRGAGTRQIHQCADTNDAAFRCSRRLRCGGSGRIEGHPHATQQRRRRRTVSS